MYETMHINVMYNINTIWLIMILVEVQWIDQKYIKKKTIKNSNIQDNNITTWKYSNVNRHFATSIFKMLWIRNFRNLTF